MTSVKEKRQKFVGNPSNPWRNSTCAWRTKNQLVHLDYKDLTEVKSDHYRISNLLINVRKFRTRKFAEDSGYLPGMSLVRERTDRSRNRSRWPNVWERLFFLQTKKNKNKKIKNLNSD